MDVKNSIIRQISANLPEVWASPDFRGERLWLTFYLRGMEEPLGRLAETLAEAGWDTGCSSADAEGGWIYPKVEVEHTVDGVMETALWVQGFCERHTTIDLIDAETFPYSHQSRIIILYKSEI